MNRERWILNSATSDQSQPWKLSFWEYDELGIHRWHAGASLKPMFASMVEECASDS